LLLGFHCFRFLYALLVAVGPGDLFQGFLLDGGFVAVAEGFGAEGALSHLFVLELEAGVLYGCSLLFGFYFLGELPGFGVDLWVELVVLLFWVAGAAVGVGDALQSFGESVYLGLEGALFVYLLLYSLHLGLSLQEGFAVQSLYSLGLTLPDPLGLD
jgi:hypothetical protein